jgi:uncharacterized protein YihD (DUF1040 family)
MIYLMQLVKMWNKQERELFIALMEDLSFEIDEMGYEGQESELIDEMLFNHLGIEMECNNQLNMLTDLILRHQGNIEGIVRGACLYGGMNVA